jgi:hypothetical protein
VASGGASGRFWSVGVGGSISGRRAAVARQNRAAAGAAAEPYYPRLQSPVSLVEESGWRREMKQNAHFIGKGKQSRLITIQLFF